MFIKIFIYKNKLRGVITAPFIYIFFMGYLKLSNIFLIKILKYIFKEIFIFNIEYIYKKI